jgi:tRNA dimethylallyltransferase
VAVVGPTAAGKSDLGVSLAQALDGDVVNTDSMQLYRGMDIGTAKLTVAERRGVPHHLLDVWDVTRTASVAEYQQDARAVVDALLAADQHVRAVVDDLEFPGTDPDVRARLERELEADGTGPLHGRLAGLDPAAAAAILPSNGRRIVRALEVIEITGRPFTATLPGPVPVYDCVQIGVDVPRPVLDERIDARVERMWRDGLVDEVRALEGQGLRDGLTASRALGYAQVLRQLTGDMTEADAKADTARATRRFARRQDTWFRRDRRVRWLAYDRPDLVEESLRQVAFGADADGGGDAAKAADDAVDGVRDTLGGGVNGGFSGGFSGGV